MNTQKQITLMVALVLLMLGGCAAYTVYDQPRENASAAAQQSTLAERGARIFARYCRQCHGNAGEGRIGPQLSRDELRNPNTLVETQQWVTDTITCGRIGKVMPPWAIREGGSLTDEQIRDLVSLITGVPPGATTLQPKNFWDKAAEFSKEENLAAARAVNPNTNVPATLAPIDETLAAASITGATAKVCGQLAPATATPAAGPPAGLKPAGTWTEDATDNKFSVTDMEQTAGSSITVNFSNKGNAIHNFEVLDASGKVLKDSSGKDITFQPIPGGQSTTLTFTIATPGVYKFHCQVHPTEMTGQLYIVGPNGETGAASPTPAAASAPTTDWKETTTDNKFSDTQVTVPAGKQVTLTVQNQGTAVHNVDVLDVKDDSGKDIKTDLVQAGKSATLTFTISKAGTYHFHCDVHPTEMTGTLVVQ
ncbi:MAG TPA: cupredoxin domain-containing protein [Dehalococcoidia bacterium]|nr:cupredoxin domain-containing protein [Dehalococcoidia bacterium]